MLEHAVLLLRPRVASGRREIRAGDTGDPAGYARWQNPEGWRRWLGRGVLEVHELEDEPLLCTVRRCWTLYPWYEVRDAEEHQVGRLLGAVIEDAEQRRCARRCWDGAA